MLERELQFSEVFYFTPTPLEKAGGFWPVRLGRNVAKPQYHWGPKYNTHYSLHFVLEGSGAFLQGNRTYSLEQGDLFCLFPKITHQYYTDKENLLQMVWIAFDGKQALPILNHIGLRPYSPYLPAVLNREVVQQLDNLFDYFRKPGNDTLGLLRHSVFFQLFHTLLTRLPERHTDNRENSDSWLQKGLEYLEMHYTEGITIAEAVRHAGMDRSHFSRRFKEKFGVSPSGYLQSLIMKEAGHMVRETNYPISEIALSVGFSDLYSFSKAFKKYYGISPTMSRKSQT